MNASTPKKVLVVDDAIEIRERLCAMLSEQDMVVAVGCPANRDEALRHVAEFEPDCVVIDVPGHDPTGFDTLATLRRHARSCLLIALATHVSEEFRRRTLRAGADHFLVKSTEFERAAELIRALRRKS